MKQVWLTYPWADNEQSDVEFVAQALESEGLKVKIDKWALQSGRRLWEDIEEWITNPGLCDGWLIYMTENTLKSQSCMEELAIAMDRALNDRSEGFPIIGLFPGGFDRSVTPASIRVRLNVMLSDDDWKERVVAGVEGRTPEIPRGNLSPYHFHIHEASSSAGRYRYAIEMRPRLGEWTPFRVGVRLEEKEKVDPCLSYGPSNSPTYSAIMWKAHSGVKHAQGEGDDLWVEGADNPASMSSSYYLYCEELPSVVYFGSPTNFYDIRIGK